MQFFDHGILFAAAGGMVGAFWAALRDRDTVVQSIAETVIAAIFAAALADYKLPADKVWICAGAGVFVGLLTGHALDVVKALAPEVLQGFFKGLAKRFLGVEDK